MPKEWTEEMRKAASERARKRWAEKDGIGRKRNPKKHAKLQCARCGGEFEMLASQVGVNGQGQACSFSCANALRATGRRHTEESKKLMSKHKRERYAADPERQERRRVAQEKLAKDPEFRAKVKAGVKRSYRDGTRDVNATVSKLELMVAPFMERLGYRHTGAGGFFVVGEGRTRCPDFKKTGEKKVLELFGGHWHRNDRGYEQDIIDWYRNAGFECEIVWEGDLAQWLSERFPEIDASWSRQQLRLRLPEFVPTTF